MATLVNDRDRQMQTSTARVVAVLPADQVVVPGYTGIKLISDVNVWNAAPVTSPYRIQPGSSGLVRETLTVQFTGIAPSTTVTWEIGSYAQAWNEATQSYIITWFTVTPVTDHGILVTPGSTPNTVRTIEQTSYPRSQAFPGKYGYMNGGIRISCTWAAQTFSAVKGIIQH
jgi:hypothetical protein